jgi:serine/threonine-protein kinase RsbW
MPFTANRFGYGSGRRS